MEKVDYKTGDVRQILSGNGLLLAGPIDQETGLPRTKYLTLAGIEAPEFSTFDKENPKQAPFGFKAREYLRLLIQGKKVEFAVEHKIKDSNDKVVGHIRFNNEDVAVELLKKGLVKVRENTKAVNLQAYQDAQASAQSKKLGLWDTNAKDTLIEFKSLNPKEIAEKNVGQKYVGGIVEDVQGLFAFYLYVNELKGLLKCCFGDIFTITTNQALVKKAKWYLDGLIYQENADITVIGYDEKLQAVRVDIFKGKQDVKKDLLTLGYYKLASNAFQLTSSQQRFNELRDAQNQAEIKGVGLWKDQQKPKQTQQGSVEKSFQGRIVEIHSGDSLSVYNEQTRVVQRIYLASVRAPVYSLKEQKPWGWESKEFLRKHAIGKTATVEVEYEKKVIPKIQEDTDEVKKPTELQMVFANIIVQDKDEKVPNLSVLLLQSGLAQVQPPRGDDGFSRYLEDLRVAQETALKTKKGIHGKDQPNPPKFNDFTIKGGSGKAKDSFNYLKNEKKLNGVVDLVLNGQRFKVRFPQNSSFNIFLLEGIKCLPNDPNFPEFQKFSNQALLFAKFNVFQRDLEIELESVDKRGLYHGHVIVNKQNFSLNLLRQGLAITHTPFGTHRYADIYAEAEQEAQKNKEGLWSIKNLNLALIRGYDDEEVGDENTKMQNLDGKPKLMVVTEIIDATEIYLQDPSASTLKKITESLSKFEPNEGNKLVAPLKKGLQCLALFSADEQWYRAKIVREITQKGKETKYEVFFLDYGNFDTVTISDIKKMPEALAQLPVQAIRTSLAYLKTPNVNQPVGQKAAEFIRSQIWEKDLQVGFNHTDGTTSYATIYLTKEKVPDRTLNILLLTQGLAKLDRQQPQCPYQSWVKANSDAEEALLGVWNVDDEEQ